MISRRMLKPFSKTARFSMKTTVLLGNVEKIWRHSSRDVGQTSQPDLCRNWLTTSDNRNKTLWFESARFLRFKKRFRVLWTSFEANLFHTFLCCFHVELSPISEQHTVMRVQNNFIFGNFLLTPSYCCFPWRFMLKCYCLWYINYFINCS